MASSTTSDSTRIDVLRLMIIKGALEEIADEMDATLYRMALSPAISSGRDGSHGIYGPSNGETLIQGKRGLPIFVGTMQASVRAVIERFGDTLEPGDTILFNDPYVGGTHIQDINVVRPIFHGGEVLCYLASVAHLADVGGPVPGGFNPTARSHFEEGLLIGPVHLSRKAVIEDELLDIIAWNSRLPAWAKADILAQYRTLLRGETRLHTLIERHGAETLSEVFDELLARSERVVRSHVRGLPDGKYSFSDCLDNDGITPGHSLTVALDLTIDGESLVLDFSRSDPTCAGPMNISRSTLEAACFIALKHLFPDVIPNAGTLSATSIIVPDDTILSALPPSAVGGYLDVTSRVIDVIFGAFAEADPEMSYAGSYSTSTPLNLSGRYPDGSFFVLFTWFGGGIGASSRGDGLCHGPGPISTASLQSIETLESRFPVTFQEYSLREDSGGVGQYRGGLGAVYRIRVDVDDSQVTIMGDRGLHPPFGIGGGGPGAGNVIEFWRADSGDIETPPLITKCSSVPLGRRDQVVIKSPGGGGYGSISKRSSIDLERDIRERYVSNPASLKP